MADLTDPKPLIDVADLVGCIARLWFYSCSHDRLQLRLTRPDGRHEYLQFIMCERIELPVGWQIAQPSLEHKREQVVYRDSAATIICQAVYLQEHDFG